jgi:hypothetical protein
MQVAVDERAATRAITIAEYREWPDRLDWDEGPDIRRHDFRADPCVAGVAQGQPDHVHRRARRDLVADRRQLVHLLDGVDLRVRVDDAGRPYHLSLRTITTEPSAATSWITEKEQSRYGGVVLIPPIEPKPRVTFKAVG